MKKTVFLLFFGLTTQLAYAQVTIDTPNFNLNYNPANNAVTNPNQQNIGNYAGNNFLNTQNQSLQNSIVNNEQAIANNYLPQKNQSSGITNPQTGTIQPPRSNPNLMQKTEEEYLKKIQNNKNNKGINTNIKSNNDIQNKYFGHVDVINAGLIKFKNNYFLLSGIITPTKDQVCVIGSFEFNCGKDSTRYLKKIIKNNKVYCYTESVYGGKIPVGTCFNYKMSNLSEMLVLMGYAKSLDRYNYSMSIAENDKRGVWQDN